MKIYGIRSDVNNYPFFVPVEASEHMTFSSLDGRPRMSSWSPPEVRLDRRKPAPGNFLNFGSGYLIADPKATEALRPLFELAGELLPLPYKEVTYTVLNVTQCIACLNENETSWERSPSGYPICINRYVFEPSRLPSSPIFKIPEELRSGIFVVEGMMKPEDEFRAIVRREGLKGLLFHELWSSDSGGIPNPGTLFRPVVPGKKARSQSASDSTVRPAPRRRQSARGTSHGRVTPVTPELSEDSRVAAERDETISADALADIRGYSEKALNVLGSEFASADPVTVVEAIDAFAYQWQKGNRPAVDVVEDAQEGRLLFGSLWGEQLISRFSWEWAKVYLSDGSFTYGVLSSDRSLAVYPLDFMLKCMQSADTDVTIALAFNMLAAGSVPAMPPRSYTNVMDGVHRIVPRD